MVGCMVSTGEGVVRTIVLASRKGGAGKTTLSCHLAVEAERQGAGPVGIVDTDPMLGLAKWWKERKAETPILAEAKPDLSAALALLRSRGVRLAFVDTPPETSAAVDKTVELADFVVVPVQPSPDDLRAVGETVRVVEKAGRRFVFVITRTKPRVKLTGQAAIALSQYGIIAPVMVADRAPYASAKTDGLTAQEAGDKSAEGEMAGLWEYIAKKMEG